MHRENSVHYKKFFKYNHFIRNSFCGVLNSDLSKAIIVVNKNLKIKKQEKIGMSWHYNILAHCQKSGSMPIKIRKKELRMHRIIS